jgi:hypothetical protein
MDEAKRMKTSQTMIEVLEFEVEPDEVERFLEADESVWTNYLSSCRGFLDKQGASIHTSASLPRCTERVRACACGWAVWVSCATKEKAQLVRATVWWESMELWKAIPQSELDEVEALKCSRVRVRCTSHATRHDTTMQVQEQFVKALGGKEYPITKADAFQLRRTTPARAASASTDVSSSITRPSTK